MGASLILRLHGDAHLLDLGEDAVLARRLHPVEEQRLQRRPQDHPRKDAQAAGNHTLRQRRDAGEDDSYQQQDQQDHGHRHAEGDGQTDAVLQTRVADVKQVVLDAGGAVALDRRGQLWRQVGRDLVSRQGYDQGETGQIAPRLHLLLEQEAVQRGLAQDVAFARGKGVGIGRVEDLVDGIDPQNNGFV